jgi:hypothetical protein
MLEIITQQTHTSRMLNQRSTFKQQWEQADGLMPYYGYLVVLWTLEVEAFPQTLEAVWRRPESTTIGLQSTTVP